MRADPDPIPSFIHHHPYPHLKTLSDEPVEYVVVEDTARLTGLTVGTRSFHPVYWLDDKGQRFKGEGVNGLKITVMGTGVDVRPEGNELVVSANEVGRALVQVTKDDASDWFVVQVTGVDLPKKLEVHIGNSLI